jgi:Ran GTPase-activating protein (RanGAP) involved in mRNA processing and transport
VARVGAGGAKAISNESAGYGTRLAYGSVEMQAVGEQLAELKASLASLQAVVAPLQASHAAQAEQIAELVAAEKEAVAEARRLRARLDVEVRAQTRLYIEIAGLGESLRDVRETVEELTEDRVETEGRVEALSEGLQSARSEAESLRSNVGRLHAFRAVANVEAGAEIVNLCGLHLGDVGAEQLAYGLAADSTRKTRARVDLPLTRLDLSCAGIQSRGAEALAAAFVLWGGFPLLRVVVMAGNAIGPTGAARLVAELGKKLEVGSSFYRRPFNLDLNDCSIGPSAPDLLAVAFGSTTFDMLSFSSNGLGATCVRRGAPALASNIFLRELRLGGNGIGDIGASALGIALAQNRVLSKLYLTSNGITAAGARDLARALVRSVSALELLCLSSNLIGELGAEAFVEVLAPGSGSVLTELDLRENNIGARGARSLATALGANSTLKKLSLARDNVGDVGARALAAALSTNRSLACLDLSGSSIGAEGVAALLAALDACTSLGELALEGNVVDTAAEQRLADRLRLNCLAPRLPAWVEAAARDRIEIPGNRFLPPALAARVGLLAFGLKLVPLDGWKSAEGRAFANNTLLPLAETALLAELQRLATATAATTSES